MELTECQRIERGWITAEDKAIDEYAQGFTGCCLRGSGDPAGLVVLGWFLIRLFEGTHQGRVPSLFVADGREHPVGAGLFAIDGAGLIVVQLVARGRRRRHLIAR